MKKIFFLLLLCFGISTYCTAQDSASYTDYYGTYKMPDGMDVSEVKIIWQDSSLNIGSDMGNAKMDKLGEDSFHMDYQDGSLKFIRDSSTHKVKGLIIYVQGMAIDAPKEEETKTGGTAWLRKNIFGYSSKFSLC